MKPTPKPNRTMRRALPALAAAALLCAALPASAQEQAVNLKFAHWVPPTHPLATAAIPQWIKAVEAASGGTIRFTVFPAGQLGRPNDHYDLARDGVADVAWHNPGLSPGRFPIFAVSQLPMLIDDSRGGSAALTEWYRGHEAREMGDVKVCFAHMMYASMLHTKAKVVTPLDLRGMKIRPSSSAEATLIRNMGGSAVPGANPQAREMIDRGVVDGTTGVPASQITFGVDKAVKYHLAIPLSQPSWVVVINKARYEAMSPRQRKALDDNCNPEAARRFAEPLHEFEAGGIPALQKRKDREVTIPTPEVVDRWRAAAGPVRSDWVRELAGRGIDGNAIYDGFVAVAAKHKALVK